MRIEQSAALVTGSNRGVGRALVQALLERGAAHVYAAGRSAEQLDSVVALDRERVVSVPLDLTRRDQINAAAQRCGDVTLLINNASVARFGLDVPREWVVEEMEVNFLGTFDMLRAFIPVVERNGGGTIVNVLSIQSLSGAGGADGYGASKAAAHNVTQAMRPGLAERGVVLSGAYPGAIDTDMLAGIEAPKSPPSVVADGILDGVEAGEDYIFPDPISRHFADIWWTDPRRVEHILSNLPEFIAYMEEAVRAGRIVLARSTG
jgi:NAD(P)-dependent dehydrogenase (short-subunit alcohol dehydrogenase family)